MFRDQKLVKPKKQTILFTVIAVLIVFFGSRASASAGYFFSLLALVAIIVASLQDSFWPRAKKPENSAVFAVFWGSMLGLVLPYLVSTFMEGGFAAIYEMLTKPM